MNGHLATPTNTLEVIKKYDFAFQKRFGQNFLIDANIVEAIVNRADITKDDCVLEVGPGIGTMTQYLCEAAGKVIAVEIDKNLIPILNETLNDYDNVRVINEDILKLDILFFKEGTDLRREQVVIANTVAMAKELNIRTIAEGVEDTEQVEFLKSIGCDVVQGYVFSRPMPLMEFDKMLKELNGRSIDVLKD